MEKFKIEEKIVAMLKTVYDPEIPVNVYDLGLIYKIDVSDNGEAVLDMTLTAPNCPAADFIMEDIRQKVESVEGVTTAIILPTPVIGALYPKTTLWANRSLYGCRSIKTVAGLTEKSVGTASLSGWIKKGSY